jgi:hypothetical protein
MRAAFSITSIAALVLAASGTFQPLTAQLLRGAVRDSAVHTPIRGAVIVLLDSAGTSVGRNITNDRGEFSIALHPEMRRAQVLRIGFRPRTLRIPDAENGVARLDVDLSPIPRLLDAVTVVDQPNCPPRADRSAAFALWEQTRAALLAVVVARETKPAQVVRLHTVRRTDGAGRLISQVVAMDTVATQRPFVATRTAADFVERGFSYDSAGGTWYTGPDADTMLDEAFVRGYCFHLAETDATRPHQVGLAFGPASRKRGRVDIEGTVWIDSASVSLADVVFKYLGMPVVIDKLDLGGDVRFRTIEDGTTLIDRWRLRTGGLVPRLSGLMTARQVIDAPIEIKETGGEVASARWPDGREWRASLGTLRGQLVDAPMAGVEVRLVDTDYRAYTDSAGRFEISNLIPGSYRIGVVDPTLAPIDLMLMTYNRFVAARDSVSDVAVVAPTASDYVAGACAASGGVRDAVLVARIEMPNGVPANDATVEVRVFVDGNARRIAQGKTDHAGLYHLCNAPRGVPLTLRVERSDTQPGFVTTEVTDHIKPVKLRLKARE